MFTGLVQGLAAVIEVRRQPPGMRLIVSAAELAAVAIGDSIALNGCCLTVVERSGDRVAFEAGPETLARTNLGRLVPGGQVNFESSLRLGDPLGGHFVTGHVDGLGTLAARHDDRQWSTCWFACEPALTRLMASKGSVAIDGVSLTLVDVEKQRFSVALIPHTLAMTTLGRLAVGDPVNLETDLLAKYVDRSVQASLMRARRARLRPSRNETRCQAAISFKSGLRSRMNVPSAGHQTVSFLMKRFAEAGVRIKARHGQNFLVDLNLLHIFVDAAELTEGDLVLEVGTGTGSLTGLIAERAAMVISVEIDPQMHQLASEELYGRTNVLLLEQDVLRGKNALAPAVVEAVEQHLQGHPGRRFKVVANLPYNVATPVISNLLASTICPHSMTVTIQKELADRIAAPPGTKDYSALSVWIQSQCHVHLLRTLPPSVFWPRPKVTSTMLQIEVDPALRSRIADRAYFHDFVRLLFCHRRKFLRGVLAGICKDRLTKPDVDELLGRLGIGGNLRAEQLDAATLLELSDAVQRLSR